MNQYLFCTFTRIATNSRDTIPILNSHYNIFKIAEPPRKKPKLGSTDETNMSASKNHFINGEEELIDGNIPKQDYIRLVIDSLQQLGYT